MARLPGVATVTPESVRRITTDAGPAWIGAPGIWDGTATGGLPGTYGEGIIVGIVDTGINPDHPSFADIGGDGYDHTNPRGAGVYVGACDPGDPGYVPSFPCNDKLIGAWDFEDGPWDTNGHGSHVGSTAAGNVLFSIPLMAPTITFWLDVSGVAPHANVISYDVCNASGSCGGAAMIAGIDQAVADGVDVINFSIGGGASYPWADPEALAFLGAHGAGIFVATSAGNSGPGASTVGSPADAPWVTAVASATHHRHFPNVLTGLSGGSTAPPADITGRSVTDGYGPAPIVYAGDYGDAGCLTPFAGGTFSGEIVVCDRGTIARVDKGSNVLAGGAGGLVLANQAAQGESVNADFHVLPAVHIGATHAEALKVWLGSGAGHTGSIAGTTITMDIVGADVLASSSSRGPASSLPTVIRPDVTGPGVDILAASPSTSDLTIKSGTSMASPHVAGSAALLRALHPSWTPSEVRSALMLTANPAVHDHDGVDFASPFGRGSGRVDLSVAGVTGLVMDETTTGFTDAEPEAGGDPTTLNLASVADPACVGSCSFTRVFTDTVKTTGPWAVEAFTDFPEFGISVSPHTLTLTPGGTGTVELEAISALVGPGGWQFGSVVLRDVADEAPPIHLPVAVRPLTADDEIQFNKSVDKASATSGEVLTYQIQLNNLTPSTTYSVVDPIPENATYVPGSAEGTVDGTPVTVTYEPGPDRVVAEGTMTPEGIGVGPGTSPGGYQGLAGYGFSPLTGPADRDEGGLIFSGLDFYYQGVHYDSVIVSVNGTVEVGTASSVAAPWTNTDLPDPAVPNNLLAPFWTDLDLRTSGDWYVGALTDGVDTWDIFEWENVPEWGNPSAQHTFQVWIERGTEAIHFIYQKISPAVPSSLTVGAENADGTLGDSYYFNSAGTAPAVGTDLIVESVPGSVGVFNFQVEVGEQQIPVVNVAELTLGPETLRASAVTEVNGLCMPPFDVVVANQTLDGLHTIKACRVLSLEEVFVTSNGDVTLCAGEMISFGDGVALDNGATLGAGVDASLSCP
jgi:uncharacterized repeat protein (TIGR01451 family)